MSNLSGIQGGVDDGDADNGMDGAFVETAFSADEVEQAIVEEKRIGVHDTPCAFVGGVSAGE